MTTRKVLILIILVSASVFCVTLYRALFYAPSDEIPLPPGSIGAINKGDPASFPLRLSVPRINVDAEVREVGITSRGNMGTPTNYDDVGWYKYGTLPGEVGSAVIAGHVDNGLSLPGVFYNLKNVQKGDDIYVSTVGGKKLHFIVSKIDTYDYNDKNTGIFTEKDGKLLRLVTCVGVWDSEAKTHDKRLVVAAILSKK